MRMLIVMPSKRRPYTLKTTQWLLKCDLPEDVRFKCFCEPQEAIHYRATLGRRNVAVLDRNDMGLGYALQYAHRYAAERGYDLCFHIDDDVNGFIDRRAQSRYRTEVFGSIVRRILADEGKDCTCSAIYLVRDGLVYVADVIYTPDNADITVPLIVEQIKRFGPSRVNVESNAAWRLYVREVRNRVAEAGLTCDVVRVNQHVNKEVRIFNQYPSVRSSFLYARKDSQSPEYARYMSDKHRYMKMVKDQRDDGVDTDAAACEFLKKSGIIPIV